jgi:hypothetical protein
VVHLGFASVPDNKFRGLTMLPIGWQRMMTKLL